MSTIHRITTPVRTLPIDAITLERALAPLVGPTAAAEAARRPDARTHRAAVAHVVAHLRGGAAHAAAVAATPACRSTAEPLVP